jgi:tmRNA-binding protein
LIIQERPRKKEFYVFEAWVSGKIDLTFEACKLVMADVDFDDGYVRISKEEFESMKATIETLEDEEVMEQLEKSQDEGSKSLKDLKSEVQ